MGADRALYLAAATATAALAATGCFRFAPEDGVYSCDPGACPAGLACAADHTCRHPTGQPGDGGSADGPDGDDCSALFVDATGGNDFTGTGCRSHPLQTIAAGIVAVFTGTREVHVCAGRYVENVSIHGVLRGGYDCKTWERTATYGYPTFDGVNESIIVNAQNTPTLWANGGPTVLDGFTVQAEIHLGVPTLAKTLEVSVGQVSVSDCKISGAAGAALSAQSVAVYVADDADLDLAHSLIEGGSGTPSTGILVDERSTGRVHIHDNRIDGGTGVSDYAGAIGVLVRGNELSLTRGTALERNLIRGGAGNKLVGGVYASVGIEAGSVGALDIVGNQIDGGQGWGKSVTAGIHYSTSGSGDLRILGNRISGGVTSNALLPLYAIRSDGNGSIDVVNNMIFGGDRDGGTAPVRAIAILETASTIHIRHNTIYVSGDGAGLYLDYQVRYVSFENNVVGGSGDRSVALFTQDCPSRGTYDSVRNNVTFGLPVLRYGANPGDGCTGGATFPIPEWAESELATECSATSSETCMRLGGTLVGGNVIVDSTCGAQASCIPRSGCADTAACGKAMFAGGSVGDVGALFGDGWKLVEGDPCAVTKSSLDLRAEVATDLYGTMRPATPSMGAHQLVDAACTP